MCVRAEWRECVSRAVVQVAENYFAMDDDDFYDIMQALVAFSVLALAKISKVIGFSVFFFVLLCCTCAKAQAAHLWERESTYASLFVSFVHFALFSYSVLYLFCHSLFCYCVLLLFLCIVFTAVVADQAKRERKKKKRVEVFIVE